MAFIPVIIYYYFCYYYSLYYYYQSHGGGLTNCVLLFQRPTVRMSGPPAGAGPGPELPDLSHLTEEERCIILSVMERQKKEEEKEQTMLK